MSPHTPKDEFLKPFRRERGTIIPFIPYIWRAAARLGDVGVEEMGKSATLSSKCIVDMQKLLGLQAVFAGIDQDLILEACGIETGAQRGEGTPEVSGSFARSGYLPFEPAEITGKGRMPMALEVARRLISLLGHDVVVALGISGPLTLSNRLWGWEEAHDEQALEKAAKLIAEIVKGFCELRVDLVVIAEADIGQSNPEIYARAISSLKSAVKICHYYDGRCALSMPAIGPRLSADVFKKTGFDGVSLPIHIGIEEEGLMADLQTAGLAAGLSLPDACFADDEDSTKLCIEQMRVVQEKYVELPLYCTTVEDLPYDVSINSIKEFATALMDMSVQAG